MKLIYELLPVVFPLTILPLAFKFFRFFIKLIDYFYSHDISDYNQEKNEENLEYSELNVIDKKEILNCDDNDPIKYF